MTGTKIFFATDVHGSDMTFKKFINAGHFYNVDVLILGGDTTGKMIVPLIERSDGSYEAEFLGSKRVVKAGKEMDDLMRSIRDTGYYEYVTTPEEMTELGRDTKKADELFVHLMQERIKKWVDYLQDRLKGTNVHIFVDPGNDDRLEIDTLLEGFDRITLAEGKVIKIDESHEMISTGWSNPTPWNTPRECSEEDLAKKIQAMIDQVECMETCIFNFHCPPYDTGIDEAPRLNEDLRPSTVGSGQYEMIPVGSKAVRESIMKHQPLLGLHGHIHESRGTVRLGRTTCVNPGSEYGEGILRGALVNVDGEHVKGHQWTSG